MLAMVSTVVTAQEEGETPTNEETSEVKPTVQVDLNESYTGGKVEVTDIADPAEDGSVVVTITVTPDEGYMIARDGIVVIPTIPSELQGTRDGSPGFADELEVVEIEDEDYTDLTKPHPYAFTVPDGLGAWVKEANFQLVESTNDISGDKDSKVVWTYDADTNELTISGEGITAGYDADNDPWAAIREQITSVVIEKGVTAIGDNLFKGCVLLVNIRIDNAEKVVGLGESTLPENEDLVILVPANLLNEYCITEGWMDFKIVCDDAVSMDGIKFGDKNQYDTFAAGEKALVVPSVLKAYAITDINEKGLVLSEVSVITPGMAVLLFNLKDLKDTDFYTAATDADPLRLSNLLKVAPEGGKEVSLGEVWMLYNDVFYYTQAGTIPEGGIYLTAPESTTKTRASYRVGAQGDATGIVNLRTDGTLEKAGQSVWYGLDGRPYNTIPTQKGIYINNGRKVVIK